MVQGPFHPKALTFLSTLSPALAGASFKGMPSSSLSIHPHWTWLILTSSHIDQCLTVLPTPSHPPLPQCHGTGSLKQTSDLKTCAWFLLPQGISSDSSGEGCLHWCSHLSRPRSHKSHSSYPSCCSASGDMTMTPCGRFPGWRGEA